MWLRLGGPRRGFPLRPRTQPLLVHALGDVVGNLPRSLRQQGIDARVLIPLYGFIDHETYHITTLFTYQFNRQGQNFEVTISGADLTGESAERKTITTSNNTSGRIQSSRG